MDLMKETHPVFDEAEDKSVVRCSLTSCEKCIGRSVSMCSALKDDEIKLLSDISINISKRSKQVICAEGEMAEYLYNVQSGCVRISKMLSDGRRQIIDFLFPGDYFGLVCDNGYNYSAETITDVNLCRMPRNAILEKIKEIPAFSKKILDITIHELLETQEQRLLLGRKNAKERLCSFLLTINARSSKVGFMKKNHIFLPMSRADIADYLGLTIETVSRQFTILAKDNIISLENSPLVRIIDIEELQLIASGG
ncbi:MAG: helix-turn-helix domain-containing protein [Alphaproteobacteria bacterium]|nr:helix-turn-helix domain-containing protein [Alphaproteobacteria bacterium]HPF45452.1 helix-turn-helix domain-containing protein [Emcibacteraceae bacterium]HRW28730.1 helix-turn-helix domain-containing protein [Emcibacteraceae bacterium]